MGRVQEILPVVPQWWDQACLELKKRDEKLGELIDQYSDGRLTYVKDPFTTLVRSVVGQQISTKAASTIWQKLKASCPEMTPRKLSKKHRRTLRTCGLSDRKVDYILDICRYFLAEENIEKNFESLSDEEIIAELTSIKGVGRWTAEMFLIFTLGRPDVFPLIDLGIIKAVEMTYFPNSDFGELGAKEKQKAILELSEKWSPYKTVASWFLWKSLNNSPMR